MGIYIPNIEKPKSCWGCFCENDAICQALALLKADSRLYEVAFHEVRPDCPLVEIPTQELSVTADRPIRSGRYIITTAPTILEAEGGDAK